MSVVAPRVNRVQNPVVSHLRILLYSRLASLRVSQVGLQLVNLVGNLVVNQAANQQEYHLVSQVRNLLVNPQHHPVASLRHCHQDNPLLSQRTPHHLQLCSRLASQQVSQPRIALLVNISSLVCMELIVVSHVTLVDLIASMVLPAQVGAYYANWGNTQILRASVHV